MTGYRSHRQAWPIIVSALTVTAPISPTLLADDVPPTPAGMVAFFPDTQCPAGWSEASYLQGRVPIAANSTASPPTTVGTAMANITAPTHKHDYSGSISLPGKSLTGDCGCCNDSGAKDGGHGFSGTTETADPGVSFVQMLACEKDADSSPPPVDPYPLATVAFFNASACPTGWDKAVGKAQGYLAHWQGNNGYSATLYFDGADTDGDGVIEGRGSSLCNGVTGTNELTDFNIQFYQNGNAVHYYGWGIQSRRCDFNFNYNIANQQILAGGDYNQSDGLNLGIWDPNNDAGGYDLTSNSSSKQVQLKQVQSVVASSAWGNTAVVLTSSNKVSDCTGTVCEPMSAAGYFVVPFCDYDNDNGNCTLPTGTAGTLVGIALTGQNRSHGHAIASSIDITTQSYVPDSLWPDSCTHLTSDGGHGFQAFSEQAPANTPYVELLLCEKVQSGAPMVPDDATDLATYFNASDCPTGWKPTETDISGTFVVGLPAKGTPNKQFGAAALPNPGDRGGHSHQIDSTASANNIPIGYQDIDRDSTGSAKGYGKADTYTYSGPTGASDPGLPYLTVLACQPCVSGDTNPTCTQGVAEPKP